MDYKSINNISAAYLKVIENKNAKAKQNKADELASVAEMQILVNKAPKMSDRDVSIKGMQKDAEKMTMDPKYRVKAKVKEETDLEEAKMEDSEVLSAAKSLAANGKNEKSKTFGKGLVDFYAKNKSFTPDQVSGLQNIMKNASFQFAKEETENLDELSKETLGSYIKKASNKMHTLGRARSNAFRGTDYHDIKYNKRLHKKRKDGISRAVDKVTKEDVSEASGDDWDSKFRGAGAKKFRSDNADTGKLKDLEKQSHQDASKASRSGPGPKHRSNDNTNGDKKIINPPVDTTKQGRGSSEVKTESSIHTSRAYELWRKFQAKKRAE